MKKRRLSQKSKFYTLYNLLFWLTQKKKKLVEQTTGCWFSLSKLTMPESLQIALSTSGLSSGKSVIMNEDSTIGSNEEAVQFVTVTC